MSTLSHAAARGWLATCPCGWREWRHKRADAERVARGHGEGL